MLLKKTQNLGVIPHDYRIIPCMMGLDSTCAVELILDCKVIMKHFTFHPNKRRKKKTRPGRNNYVGCWVEPEPRKIELRFTLDNLRSLVENAYRGHGDFSHFDVARWCSEFVAASDDSDDESFIAVSEIAEDIDLQWDMNLFNRYSREELQVLDIDSVKLPSDWWRNWLQKIEQLKN